MFMFVCLCQDARICQNICMYAAYMRTHESVVHKYRYIHTRSHVLTHTFYAIHTLNTRTHLVHRVIVHLYV